MNNPMTRAELIQFCREIVALDDLGTSICELRAEEMPREMLDSIEGLIHDRLTVACEALRVAIKGTVP